jgi:hypothetical protein
MRRIRELEAELQIHRTVCELLAEHAPRRWFEAIEVMATEGQTDTTNSVECALIHWVG